MKPLLSEEDLYRILRDLLTAFAARKRKYSSLSMEIPPDARFSEPPLNLDSLEVMEMTASVNEMFHLYKTGLEDNLLRFRSLDKWTEVVGASWQRHPETITFRTSGTMSSSRACTHDSETLVQEAEELAEIFAGNRRIISMVPAHHIYGFLFTVLLPRVMEIPVADGRLWSVGRLSADTRPDDLIVSFPLGWSCLDKSLPRWPGGIKGVTSTGPCRPEIIRSLTAKGLERITEIYGSSETGGLGFRHQPDDPYTLFSYWRRSDMVNDDSPLVRTNAGNRGEDTILSSDILQWYGERTFRPCVRRDGAVQVGGVNVYPLDIARRISEHPQVEACGVRLMGEKENPRLKAFVVPASDVNITRLNEELESWILRNLSSAERPVHFTFGLELPMDAVGKIQDW